MAKEGDDLKAALFCFGMGGLLVWQGLRRLKRKRITEDTPHTDIASAPQGLCEIQGFAWPLAGTAETLSGRKAVYLELVLEKLVKQGKSSTWKRQWGRTHKMPFYVLDSTGCVTVNPEKAEVEVKNETWPWGKLPDDMKARASRLNVAVSGFPPTSLFFGLATSGSWRFREKAVLLGAPVYVHGTLQASREAYVPPSLALQRFTRFLGTLGRKRVAAHAGFDRNRDGKVCEDEAERALNEIGENAFRELAAGEQPPLPGAPPAENRIYGQVVACAERNLYLADCHQEHLVKRIGSGNFLMIVGGACLIGVGAFIVVAKLTGGR